MWCPEFNKKLQNIWKSKGKNTDVRIIKEFKISTINMLKIVIEKVNNMHAKMGNFSPEIVKSQMEC